MIRIACWRREAWLATATEPRRGALGPMLHRLQTVDAARGHDCGALPSPSGPSSAVPSSAVPSCRCEETTASSDSRVGRLRMFPLRATPPDALLFDRRRRSRRFTLMGSSRKTPEVFPSRLPPRRVVRRAGKHRQTQAKNATRTDRSRRAHVGIGPGFELRTCTQAHSMRGRKLSTGARRAREIIANRL